uniref:Aldo/keto reductase n=1 Tax=uncultured miscellaneous Crenarchaeota group TaxID=1368239 RepID=W8RW73_9ARCH|nr:aldo/keto reductase [uncultured miscellaneous Crenarchaeota group]
MDYRRLGRSGLMVSPICLGTMMFGGRTDTRTAGQIVSIARDSGVNFIDTADVYNIGESERIVGKHIAQDRDKWVLATKAGDKGKGVINEGWSGRKWLMQAIDESLDRLNTDYVDIWYLHKPDFETPLEETLSAVADVIASGKARYWGISNFRGWWIAEAVRVADSIGLSRPVVCQPYYNAMDRTPEVEILPACGHYGIGVVPYSPLARGVLTGKYRPGEEPGADSRAGSGDARMMETEFRPESLAIAEKLTEHAKARGMTPGDYALLWVLNNRLVSSVLAGPRTVEQWEVYLGSLRHEFTAEDEALLNSMVPPGHPSTPGYSDPQYPITGRPVRVG